jgi:mRNA-degrading endonuclease RelE of RelBE toxin-antitoxin system
MKWFFLFSEKAKKDTHGLDRGVQIRIRDKILFWENTDNIFAFAENLTEHSFATHRLRVGDFRLLCRIQGTTIEVLRVGPRDKIYKLHS